MKAHGNAFKFVISIFIMLSAVLLNISIFTRAVFLNPSFYASALGRTNYYDELSAAVSEGFSDYSLITSIPADVLSKGFTPDALKAVTESEIKNFTGYMKFKNELDRNSRAASIIENNMVKYNESLGGSLSENLVSDISSEAGDIVKRHVSLIDMNAVSKYGEFQTFRAGVYGLYKGTYLFAVFFAACALLLLPFLNKDGKTREFLFWTGSSVTAAALLFLAAALAAAVSKAAGGIPIGSGYIKTAAGTFSNGYILYFAISGAVMLAAGIAAITAYSKTSHFVGGK